MIAGTIPIGEHTAELLEDFQGLLTDLEISQGDNINLYPSYVDINVDNDLASRRYDEAAKAAITHFALKHATEGAVFDFDDGVLVVGPTPEARQAAHTSYLKEEIAELDAELDHAMLNLQVYQADSVVL